MHCINCGKRLVERAKFCWSCGAEVDTRESKLPVPKPETFWRGKRVYGWVIVVTTLLGFVGLSVFSSRNTAGRVTLPEELLAKVNEGDDLAQAELGAIYWGGDGGLRPTTQSFGSNLLLWFFTLVVQQTSGMRFCGSFLRPIVARTSFLLRYRGNPMSRQER